MNLPTKITMARLFLIPVFVALYLIEFPYHMIISTVVFAVASFTDFLDGHLARKYNLVTDLGKFLDPVADKVLVAAALILVVKWSNALQLYVLIATIVILARELIVTCFRTIAATKNVVLAADRIGKSKTVSQLIGLILYLPFVEIAELNATVGNVFMYVGFGFLMLATVLTIVSACNYIIKNRNVLKQD